MHQLQTLIPQLKLLAMASVEQAAAVALGATVIPKERAVGSTKKSLEATVNLEVRHDVVNLTVTVGANLRSSTAIAARLREILPEEVTSERMAEALGEFATTVAEQLSAALEEAGVQTTPNLPVVSMDGKKRRPPSPEALLIVADSCPSEFSVYVRIDGYWRASG